MKNDNPARKKFEPMLSPFVDGELSPSERQQVEQHLAANKESAMQVADLLGAVGVQTRLLSMHTVRPIDTAAIESAVLETGAVFTLEEHSVVGGLGGAVAEFLTENWEGPLVFKRFGLPSEFSCFVGSQEYMRARHGLTAEAVALGIRAKLGKAHSLTAVARV